MARWAPHSRGPRSDARNLPFLRCFISLNLPPLALNRGPSWVKNPTGFSGLAPGNQITAEAKCPLNKYVISGGGQSLFKQLVMASSHPNSDNTGWTVIWTNTGATTIDSTVTPYAMCAGTGLIALP